MTRLAGRRVVVTGAAGGIGAAIVRTFAREGARLALLDSRGEDTALLAKEVGGWGYDVDLADVAATREGMDRAIRSLGGIDVLVNGAALPRSAPRPVDLGDAVLESAAWYREARAALPVWREGTLVLGRSGSVRWQGRGDRRASLRLSRDDLRGVRIRPAPAPVGDRVLELRTESATAELAGGDLERWATLLRAGEEDQAGIAGTGAPT